MNLTYLCSGFVNVSLLVKAKPIHRLKVIFLDNAFRDGTVVKIKRRNKFLLFAPNLTMNLTYLCSGISNMD
jgi:hypothetical protein